MKIQNIHVHGKMSPHKFLTILREYDREQFSSGQLWKLEVVYHEIISKKDELEKMQSSAEELWDNLYDEIVYEFAVFQQ